MPNKSPNGLGNALDGDAVVSLKRGLVSMIILESPGIKLTDLREKVNSYCPHLQYQGEINPVQLLYYPGRGLPYQQGPDFEFYPLDNRVAELRDHVYAGLEEDVIKMNEHCMSEIVRTTLKLKAATNKANRILKERIEAKLK
ncbi:hypothetical protein KA107_01980 [Candidatus Pacearchaeota archaeon]|nr:hypothetical protein [Candidatus Pacearchaeota archaeon]